MSKLFPGDSPAICSEKSPRSDVTALVAAALAGHPSAWEHLVARYEPLVASITRRYRLSAADSADISQMVWLKLFEHLPGLHEPRALPGWIVTTTSRACLRWLSDASRTVIVDHLDSCRSSSQVWGGLAAERLGEQGDVGDQLFRTDCCLAVMRGLDELAPHEQELLVLVLVADPPLSYRQISERLGLPIGSIGPQRARYLKKLRRTGAVRRLGLTADLVESAA